MTNDELQNLVQKISQQDFKRSFKHQAMFNARLRTTGGRYILKTHNLEFNPKMISVPEFEAIIKHELVHYHLHL
ncbi:MAG: SprT-like domain-containing protein, partial [Leuconostoc fallax]